MRLSTFGRGVLIAGALVLLAGCGDDEENAQPVDSGETPEDAASGSAAVTVIAEDISFPEASYAVDAGEVDLTYRNEGSIKHTLVIEDVDGFKLTVAAQGDVDEGAVELEPGQYTIFCDVPGHREAGMEATLDVS